MIRKVRFEQIPYEEMREKLIVTNYYIAARLHIDPPLDAALIQKIKKEIKGVGWVEDQVDYAAIYSVSPKEILLSSGCAAWCEHMQRVVYEIVETLKHEGEVNYEGPSIYPPILV